MTGPIPGRKSMMMKQARMFAAALSLVCMTAIPAWGGTVIFSDLGPSDSYMPNTSYALGSPISTDDYVAASAFTVGGSLSFTLSTIEVAANLVSGTNQLFISIDADSSGLPGATLESFTINNELPQVGTYSSGNLLLATSVIHPLLTAGSQYWVVLSAPDTTWAGWNFNSTGVTGPLYQSNNGVPVNSGTLTLGAMRITGNVVPEPSSLVLSCMAALSLLGCGLARCGKAHSAS